MRLGGEILQSESLKADALLEVVLPVEDVVVNANRTSRYQQDKLFPLQLRGWNHILISLFAPMQCAVDQPSTLPRRIALCFNVGRRHSPRHACRRRIVPQVFKMFV